MMVRCGKRNEARQSPLVASRDRNPKVLGWPPEFPPRLASQEDC